MDELVFHIIEDIRKHAPFRNFEGRIGERLERAYALQDELAARIVESGVRGPCCGYKIALNSPSLMAHFGVDEPVSGHLFEDQKHFSPAELAQEDYRTLLIEPEIAAVIGNDLPGGPGLADRERVAAAIEVFVPAFEIVDTRGAHIPDLKLPAAIAQNMTNEGLVVGGPGIAPAELDVDSLSIAVIIDGAPVADLTGAAPQHPLDAIAWLADHLEHRGKRLRAGQIVLCGSHMPARPVGTARHVRAEMGVLGAVEFRVRPASARQQD